MPPGGDCTPPNHRPSRQIRDLELEIGVKLLDRKTQGIALTAAGRIFLDHARLALMQIEVASEAARSTERPEKPGFVIGVLLGQEVIWLPELSYGSRSRLLRAVRQN